MKQYLVEAVDHNTGSRIPLQAFASRPQARAWRESRRASADHLGTVLEIRTIQVDEGGCA